MKTVYEYFLTYADSLLTEKDSACKRNVALGIKAFLAEMELADLPDPDGRISERESLRFKLMPAETFVAYFENYKIRSRILQFQRECRLLAVSRLKNNTLISAEEKTRKLSDFYELVAELALDKRYTSWIDEMAMLVKADLSFATGKTNMISRDLAEWLERNS